MRRNWRNEAREALEELRDCPFGGREARLRDLADGLSYKNGDTSSLRRAMGAVQFLDLIETERPASFADLNGVPLSVAELMERLYKVDPDEFAHAARDWRDGLVTVADMRDRLERSTPHGYSDKVGKALQTSFREAAADAVRQAVRDLGVGEIVSVRMRGEADLPAAPVDYLFGMNSGCTVAVLAVGPYRNETMYRDRVEAWALRAFGVAWLHDVVLLAVPDEKYAQNYRQRIQEISRSVSERPAGEDAALPRVMVTNIFPLAPLPAPAPPAPDPDENPTDATFRP